MSIEIIGSCNNLLKSCDIFKFHKKYLGGGIYLYIGIIRSLSVRLFKCKFKSIYHFLIKI
jgi:hypothetical protein